MLPQRCRLHAAPFSHDDFVEKQTGLVDFGKRGEMGMMIDGSSSSIQRTPWPIHYTIFTFITVVKLLVFWLYLERGFWIPDSAVGYNLVDPRLRLSGTCWSMHVINQLGIWYSASIHPSYLSMSAWFVCLSIFPSIKMHVYHLFVYYLNINTTLWDLYLPGIRKQRWLSANVRILGLQALWSWPLDLGLSCSWDMAPSPVVPCRWVPPVILWSGPPLVPSPWKWGFGSAHLPPGHSDLESRAAFGWELSFVWVPSCFLCSRNFWEICQSYEHGFHSSSMCAPYGFSFHTEREDYLAKGFSAIRWSSAGILTPRFDLDCRNARLLECWL